MYYKYTKIIQSQTNKVVIIQFYYRVKLHYIYNINSIHQHNHANNIYIVDINTFFYHDNYIYEQCYIY